MSSFHCVFCVYACVCVHVYLRVCMLVCMSETDKPMQMKITGEEEIVYVMCADFDNTSVSVMCVQTLIIQACL